MSPILLLLCACLAILVGPLCGLIGRGSQQLASLIDGFALVVITAICLLVVLPHAAGELGLMAAVLTASGAILPMVAHHYGQNPRWSQVFILLALGFHLLLDGAVLSVQEPSGLMGWAVVIHRLPVGFAIALAAGASAHPMRTTLKMGVVMIVATVLGYLLGPSVVTAFPHEGVAGLEALVAGVLLHIAFMPHTTSEADKKGLHDDCNTHDNHCAHDHGHADHGHADHEHGHGHGHGHGHHHHGDEPSVNGQKWAALGTMLGIFVVLTGPFASHGVIEDNVSSFIRTLGVLVLESAPALLIGYALAGIVPFLLTPSRATALGRGSPFKQSLKGVAFGLPLPVCSCGVLPLYESLIRRGAPPVAAMAFFVATPELGLDAVLLSVPLLGSSLTVARVIAAFMVAVLVALIVGRLSTVSTEMTEQYFDSQSEGTWRERIRSGLRFGFVDVFDHTMPWICLGLIIAAVCEPMLSHGAIETIPTALQVPIAALVGIPMYVCASGATPIAALAIHKGLSTGATMAFLIAGPATNVTTFGVLAKLHGRRVALLFGFAVTLLAVLAGWMIDLIGVEAAPVLDAHRAMEAHGSWSAYIAVVALSALLIVSVFRQGPRGALRQILKPIHMHEAS